MKASYSEYTENGIFIFYFLKNYHFYTGFTCCGAVVLREILV